MTTAERDITDSDGTAADWFDMGSGRIDLTEAAKAGLRARRGPRPATRPPTPPRAATSRTLNTASMADNECLQTCDWTRTLTGTATGVGTWTVAVESLSDGLTLTADKSSCRGRPTAATSTSPSRPTVAAALHRATGCSAPLVLTPPAGSTRPWRTSPWRVLPSAGVLPDVDRHHDPS